MRFVHTPLCFTPQGWKIVGLKLVTPGRALVELHYEEHVGKVRGHVTAVPTGGFDLLSGT